VELYKQALMNKLRLGILMFCAALLCSTVISGCSNPEQVKRQREETFRKFCTSVAKHMLDRNPDTIKESMTLLFRDELTEPVIEKLQSQGHLPKTELGILKIVSEQEEQKASNVVTVAAIKPAGPIEKDVVPFVVTGQVTEKSEGKPDRTEPYTLKLSCKLNEQTGGYPQVVDATLVPPAAKPAPPPEPAAKKKKKRRRH
jgi:hypothetical protein